MTSVLSLFKRLPWHGMIAWKSVDSVSQDYLVSWSWVHIFRIWIWIWEFQFLFLTHFWTVSFWHELWKVSCYVVVRVFQVKVTLLFNFVNAMHVDYYYLVLITFLTTDLNITPRLWVDSRRLGGTSPLGLRVTDMPLHFDEITLLRGWLLLRVKNTLLNRLENLDHHHLQLQ